VTRQGQPGRRGPVRIYFANLREMPRLFWVTEERYRDALARHPGLDGRVEAVIGWDFEDFETAIKPCDGLVGWRFPTESLAAGAPELRWIHIIGAGIEHLQPLTWLPERVIVTNNRGVHVPKAAEFATMAILMLNNRIPLYVSNMREGRWQKSFTSLVEGRTLTVIGVGHIGSEVARRAKRMKMHVLGVRRSRRPHRYVDEMYARADLAKVLPRTDFLFISAPLTDETQQLIGRRELDLLRPEAGVINMGRAGIVDYEALGEKLARGELSGAILDVFDTEPLPRESPLWSAPNLVITPHVSSDDPERYAALSLDLIFDNVRRYLAGRPLRNVVDRARGY